MAGDSQRVWFPEIVDALRAHWHGELTMDDLVGIARELNGMLRSLRERRGIRPVQMRCRGHGGVGEFVPLLTVRSAILAAGRFDIADITVVKDLDKAWGRHRKKHGLDTQGVPRQPSTLAREQALLGTMIYDVYSDY